MTTFEIKEGIILALSAVRTNKMRSFLTVLGVLIGVASVIGMVSIITGLNNSMAAQIQSLGSNVIYVTRFEPGTFGNISEEERNRKEITLEHAMAVKNECPSIGAVSPQNWGPGRKTAKYGRNKMTAFGLVGVMPEYEIVNNNFVRIGRFITESDVRHKAKLVVLGHDVCKTLFETTDPIDKQISIAGRDFSPRKFVVIGVMEERKNIMGRNMNSDIFLPYDTYKILYPYEKELLLVARPRSPELTEKAIDEIREVLRRERGVPYNKTDDFAVYTQENMMQTYRSITSAIYLVMIVISSIGLMVGGVGVMNIMLVSVTERTKEIGIRKAVGAKRRNILWQFLIEAMTLSGVGGALGIVFGLAIAWIVKLATPLPAGISIGWIIIGFSVSVSVGLVFGIYPAYRAVRVDPIVSLRYE
jgi:putative ABC transport system permease protein